MISILIPTYNRSKFLIEALASIKNQTYQDYKVFIYDDGSTDNTEDVVGSCSIDNLFYKKSSDNNGVAYARNKLLEMCDTKYACWMDSDDISNYFRLEELYKVILESGVHIVNSDWHSIHLMNQFPWLSFSQRPLELKNEGRASCFAGIMFEVGKAVRFNELKNIGEDSQWRSQMRKKYGSELKLWKKLYFVRRKAEGRISNIYKSRRIKIV